MERLFTNFLIVFAGIGTQAMLIMTQARARGGDQAAVLRELLLPENLGMMTLNMAVSAVVMGALGYYLLRRRKSMLFIGALASVLMVGLLHFTGMFRGWWYGLSWLGTIVATMGVFMLAQHLMYVMAARRRDSLFMAIVLAFAVLILYGLFAVGGQMLDQLLNVRQDGAI